MNKKSIACLILSFLLLIILPIQSIYSSTSALSDFVVDDDSYFEFLDDDFEYLKSYLTENETDIDTEINNAMSATDFFETSDGLQVIYDEYLDDLEELGMKRDSNKSLKSQSAFWYQTIKCRIAVVAAIAVFGFLGCNLSMELLVKARLNDNSNLTYNPYYGYLAGETELVQSIIYGSEISGKRCFEFDYFNRINLDMYCAIRWFSFVKPYEGSTQITIFDIYDFAPEKENSWYLLKIAVRVMYNAQQLGVITPYNIEIHL